MPTELNLINKKFAFPFVTYKLVTPESLHDPAEIRIMSRNEVLPRAGLNARTHQDIINERIRNVAQGCQPVFHHLLKLLAGIFETHDVGPPLMDSSGV